MWFHHGLVKQKNRPSDKTNCINSNLRKVGQSFGNESNSPLEQSAKGRDFFIIRNAELKIKHASKMCAVLQHVSST